MFKVEDTGQNFFRIVQQLDSKRSPPGERGRAMTTRQEPSQVTTLIQRKQPSDAHLMIAYTYYIGSFL